MSAGALAAGAPAGGQADRWLAADGADARPAGLFGDHDDHDDVEDQQRKTPLSSARIAYAIRTSAGSMSSRSARPAQTPARTGRRRSGRAVVHRHPSEGLSVKLAAAPRWRGRRRAVQTDAGRFPGRPRLDQPGGGEVVPAHHRGVAQAKPGARIRAQRDGRRVGLDLADEVGAGRQGDLQVAGIDCTSRPPTVGHAGAGARFRPRCPAP